MNWGHGVTIAFALFVGYIMYLVVGCLNQDVHLVADDYYAQEVAYQDRINEIKNAEPFVAQISVSKTENQVMLTLPTGITSAIESGSIHFFRPSDETLDILVDMKDVKGNTLAIDQNQLQAGRYEVKIQWNVGGQGYYVKKDLFI